MIFQSVRTAANQVASGVGATISGGSGNIASGALSTVSGGGGALAINYGEDAYGSGTFATPGDAQLSNFIMRTLTTNAIQTELFLDGSSQRIILPDNTHMGCQIDIIARQSGGTASAFFC